MSRTTRALYPIALCALFAACNPAASPAPPADGGTGARAALRPDTAAPAEVRRVRELLYDHGLIGDPMVRDSMASYYTRAREAKKAEREAAAIFLSWLERWALDHPGRVATLRTEAATVSRWNSPYRLPAVPDSIRERTAASPTTSTRASTPRAPAAGRP